MDSFDLEKFLYSDIYSSIMWPLNILIILFVLFFFRYQWLYNFPLINKNMVLFNEIKYRVRKKIKKYDLTFSQASNDFFRENEIVERDNRGETIKLFQKAYENNAFDFVEIMRNQKFTKDSEKSLIKLANEIQVSSSVPEHKENFISEHQLLGLQEHNHSKCKSGILELSLINLKRNDAGNFLRCGYFAFFIDAFEAPSNKQKDIHSSWIELFRKKVKISKNFASDPALITSPFRIYPNKYSIDNAAYAAIEFYDFFREHHCKIGLNEVLRLAKKDELIWKKLYSHIYKNIH